MKRKYTYSDPVARVCIHCQREYLVDPRAWSATYCQSRECQRERIRLKSQNARLQRKKRKLAEIRELIHVQNR